MSSHTLRQCAACGTWNPLGDACHCALNNQVNLIPNLPSKLPVTRYPRHITHIAGAGNILYALDDTGTAWRFINLEEDWAKLPPLPETAPAEEPAR